MTQARNRLPADAKIISYLAQGMEIAEIALRHNCTYYAVRDRIRDYGLDLKAETYDARADMPDTAVKVWRFYRKYNKEDWQKVAISVPRITLIDGKYGETA